MNNIPEIIVVLDEDGITPLTSISEKTFHSYKILTDNSIEITEQTGMKIICNINPHNTHIIQAVKKWQA